MIEQVISPSDVYWITRCDAIKHMTVVLGVISAVATFLCLIIWGIASSDRIHYKMPKRLAAIAAPVAVLCLVVNAMTPTTKEMCAIIVIPAVANNDGVQDIAVEVKTLATDWLKELRPEKKVENEPTGK